VRFLRAACRLAFLVLTVGGGLLYLRATDGLLRVTRRLRGSRESTGPWRARVLHAWARVVACGLGMRMETRGEPPRPPFFLVSNHLSYTDIVLLAAQLPCVFVSKAEVGNWPIFGAVCRSVDTLFIDRENKRDIPRVTAAIEKILRDGRGVIIFPEGTSGRGDRVLRFKPSLLEPAARTGLPVSYASLHYETPPGGPPARDAVCWFGGAGFLSHVLGIVQLPWFRGTVTFGERPISGGDRKSLALRLHAAVEESFRPVAGGEEHG
jgi:1-acyl-sn-glycerol-3-phosphate acyltransferase